MSVTGPSWQVLLQPALRRFGMVHNGGVLDGIDVEGPVLAEVFLVSLEGDAITLTGPCGPAPWHLETTAGEHPVDVVRRVVTGAVGDPQLVHSTSWRQGAQGVVLTFLVLIRPDQVAAAAMEKLPVTRADLARSGASSAPTGIEPSQVLEHAVRHLAWLATDDAAVRSALSPRWLRALKGYRPEPFRNLG